MLAVLDAGTYAEVLQAGELRTYRRSDVILRQDEAVDGLYVVGQGRVGLYRVRGGDRRVKQLLLAVKGVGDAFDLSALVSGGPASVTAVAAERTTLRFIEMERARCLLLEKAETLAVVLSGLAADLRRTMDVVRGLCFHTVPERLAAALLQAAPWGVAHCTVQELAARVGTSREVVSRQLHRLARQGAVALPAPGEVRILCPDRLQRLAVTGGEFG
jgi:CRP/FNR family transcriptional regulator